MPPRGTVLVTGATGRQGGAVASALLDRGWSIRALTRDASQPAAGVLAQRGAELIQGDLEDRDFVYADRLPCVSRAPITAVPEEDPRRAGEDNPQKQDAGRRRWVKWVLPIALLLVAGAC